MMTLVGILIGLALGVLLGRLVWSGRRSDASAEPTSDTMRRYLTRAQRMEALGILSGSLMHNLNNLLSVVLGQARLAREKVQPDSDAWRHMGQVIQAAEAAAELSREVDSFHREEDDGRHPVRLQPVVRATVKLLRDILPDTVDIESELDTACGPVLASPSQLQQILMSLCSNAYHAMFRRRGRITIGLGPTVIEEPREAIPRELAPGHYVKLTVADNGRGMDTDTIQHIFEPYFSAQGNRPGAGLGLTVVARLLAANEGVAVVTSLPGHGSRFELFFPVVARSLSPKDLKLVSADHTAGLAEPAPTPAPAAEPARARSRAVSGRHAHVLVVEDDPLVGATVRDCLERSDLEVTVLTDGSDAVAAFASDPGAFDLVLTDQLLAGLDGREVVREIRRHRPRVPAIIMSGHPEGLREADIVELRLAGMLAKPFKPTELIDLVRKALREDRQSLEGEA
jgi:signal transduction histidine kinase/ActR/RegA family two-component response regulator